MKNINELIVILNNLDFRDDSKRSTVFQLKSWVDSNRNLIYKKYEMELIRKVDEILENHNLYNKEKIMSLCNDVLNNDVDNLLGIRQLNDIIENIFHEGKVNVIEIQHLKKWLNSFGDIIRKKALLIKLYNLIDNVIKCGIATKIEQEDILCILKEIMGDVLLENKINYLCRLIKEKKIIGVELIDILNDESAICEIHKRAEKNINQAINSYSEYCENQEIIIVSLVLIAMLKYDGNFYEFVRNTYVNLYESYSEQKVEGKIRSILSKYKKQSDSSIRSRIINIVLENTIVPKSFLAAFFEFIFDIYKLNFEYDLPEELYEEFKFVYEGLQNNMILNNDDISINVTHKTYKLISTTKQLISKEDGLDAIIKLSIIIVNLIDRRFWNEDINISNSYLKFGYDGWEKTLKENYKISNARKKTESELRSRWEPKFEIINNCIYLKPPIHKIKAQYNYRDIVVIVLNGEKEIYRNNKCDIYEIIGGYQIKVGAIEILNPLGKLEYRLMVGDKIIYDSKDKLYRNFLIFNREGQEIHNNTDFEGTVFIAYKNDKINFNKVVTKEHYSLGYKHIRLGDVIEIDKDIFNFSSIVKPGIFGQLYSNCYVQREGDVNLISVFYDKCCVRFEAEKKSSKFEIVLNRKSYKLSKLSYNSIEKKSTIIYIVDLGLQYSGIYDIEVNQLISGNKNKIFQTTFAYDLGLSFSKESISESMYKVKYTSELVSNCIETEINIERFDPAFIRFSYNRINYSYYIPFNFGFYKLSDSERYSKMDDLWINDIKENSILSLYDSECDGLLLYTEAGILAEENIKLIDKGYYKQISVYFLTSYKNSNKFVTLAFTVNGRVKYRIRCYNKCVIDEAKTEILCIDKPKRVMFKPVFYGKNKVYFELYNIRQEKIFTSGFLESGKQVYLENFKSFEKYTIKFCEKTNMLLRKNLLISEIHKTFYPLEDFIGRSFKIQEIYFNQVKKGVFVEEKRFLNKYYIKFTKIINLSKGLFEGEIYSKTPNRVFFLYNINPVTIEICSGEMAGLMELYITNQEDGLLFDLNYKGILNSIDHPTAPDIFLYIISLKGES